MKPSKFLYIPQEGDVWHSMRREKITASDIAVILGVSPWSNSSDLWRRKVGFLGGIQQNSAMAYGTEMEPIIRDRVNKDRGTNYVPCIVLHGSEEWRMSSLDGYDEETNTLLEIKCANAVDHKKAKGGTIPAKYTPQCMWQLHTAQLENLIYASFHQDEIVYVEVSYDPAYISEHLPAIAAFYKCVIELEEPKCIDNNQSVKGMVDELLELKKQSVFVSEKLKNCEGRILEAVGNKEVKSDCLSVSYVPESSSVDFKKIWEDLKTSHPEIADEFIIDNYLKKRVGFWKITPKNTEE